jgi:hypothetical protein
MTFEVELYKFHKWNLFHYEILKIKIDYNYYSCFFGWTQDMKINLKMYLSGNLNIMRFC